MLMLQKALSRVKWTHCALLHAHLQYICSCPWFTSLVITEFPDTTEAICFVLSRCKDYTLSSEASSNRYYSVRYISKAKFKPKKASFLIFPIWDAFWRHAAFALCWSSSTSDLHFCQSRSLLPASTVQASSSAFPPEDVQSGFIKIGEEVVAPLVESQTCQQFWGAGRGQLNRRHIQEPAAWDLNHRIIE